MIKLIILLSILGIVGISGCIENGNPCTIGTDCRDGKCVLENIDDYEGTCQSNVCGYAHTINDSGEKVSGILFCG